MYTSRASMSLAPHVEHAVSAAASGLVRRGLRRLQLYAATA
jgi:hypothetical protein